ncbi:LOW QUALITY PROTEIN: neutral alpha-glucosidase C-like [Lingula anatina]|uniref:Glucosidase II subunit alpha n=1 Tax=Lingula anatina TaxID=7574 RepID=A0A1S3JAX2_LINAN|nr:LOW QUALITY PROTEIN: neutral alpha-glucosidase C-like [Lingula anatina]|eukprot:XP_013407547.1 LOW QUALITY PROTEIN: neutral alpha-glucosidase C-like [Lingula anatina]
MAKFRTCNDASFFRRQKYGLVLKYTACIGDAEIEDNVAKIPLNRDDGSDKLILQFRFYKNGAIRVTVDEAQPLRPRYSIPEGDVLEKNIEGYRITVVKQSASAMILKLYDSELSVVSQPFTAKISCAGQTVFSLNSYNFFRIECYRKKSYMSQQNVTGLQPGKRKASDSTEDEPPLKKSKSKDGSKNLKPTVELNQGLWEEDYQGVVDSKPYGPSSIGADVVFVGFQHLYGLPEHALRLSLDNTEMSSPIKLYNADHYGYAVGSTMSLYGNVPAVIAHSPDITVGFMWLNASETWVSISKETWVSISKQEKTRNERPQVMTHWVSESGVMDMFFMPGPSPWDIFKQYADLTGKSTLPPLFALGYHQCRWNYDDEADVRSVDARLEEQQIPYDVIWLDIEHTDGKRYFTWDKAKFPDPKALINDLARKGHKVVTIVDPHIKKDPDYYIFREGTEKGYFIKDFTGKDCVGECWPGDSCWLDYTNPEVRDYWASQFSLEKYQGSTLQLHIWNDMNEPSIFGNPDTTMTKDAVHYKGWEHRDLHNVYGMYQQMATYKGLLDRSSGKERPFVLSRSFFAGSQRWGAVWTGDNVASWEHLKLSMPMLMTLNLFGINLCGTDVGGFEGEPTAELLTRWYQTAAYQPFFREHSTKGSKRREPYLQPPEHLEAIRQAIYARYRLLPYWYTLFYEAEIHCRPVIRPLWVEFPKEEQTFTVEDCFMIGNALLVHPVTTAAAKSVEVYCPGEKELWYDVDSNLALNGGQRHEVAVTLKKTPVFQRGGTIIPRKAKIQLSSELMKDDPVILYIGLDSQGAACGTLYIDDGHSFDYKSGNYLYLEYSFKEDRIECRVNSCNYKPQSSVNKMYIVGMEKRPVSATLVQESASTELQLTYNSGTKCLTLPVMEVPVWKPWTIQLNYNS